MKLSLPKLELSRKEKKPKAEKTSAVKQQANQNTPSAAKKGRGGGKSALVLMLGDEGGILVFMQGKRVIKRLFAANTELDNIKPFRDLFALHPQTPLYALVDMMDQSYMKQTFPPVSKFSIHKLIRRKLERDFGPEDITGAFPIGREKGGRKDWNYMMVSLAGTPQLMQWTDYILALPNPFQGLYLNPIEGAGLISELTRLHIGKEARPWQLLVCHHKVGGFRQIILKEGKLTFTRLAQAASDTSPEVIAGSIEQEVGSTIEYLKRLSYSEDQGLECFMILSAEIKKHIEVSKIKAVNVVLLTPFEAAESLGISGAALPEDHYADVVVASFFGQCKKKILPLHNRISGKLAQFRQWGKISLIATGIFLALFGSYMLYSLSNLLPASEEEEMLQMQIRGIQATVEEANRNLASLVGNLERMEDIIELQQFFKSGVENPLIGFLKKFNAAAQGDIFVRKIDYTDLQKTEDILNQNKLSQSITVEVQFTDSSGSVKAFALKARKLFERLKTAFPEYQFANSKLPGIIDQAEAFQADFSEKSKATTTMTMSGEPVIVTLTFSPPANDQPAY